MWGTLLPLTSTRLLKPTWLVSLASPAPRVTTSMFAHDLSHRYTQLRLGADGFFDFQRDAVAFLKRTSKARLFTDAPFNRSFLNIGTGLGKTTVAASYGRGKRVWYITVSGLVQQTANTLQKFGCSVAVAETGKQFLKACVANAPFIVANVAILRSSKIQCEACVRNSLGDC